MFLEQVQSARGKWQGQLLEWDLHTPSSPPFIPTTTIPHYAPLGVLAFV